MRRIALILLASTAALANGCGSSTTSTTDGPAAVTDAAAAGDAAAASNPDLAATAAGDMTSPCPDGKVSFIAIPGGDVSGIKLSADMMTAFEPTANDPWFAHLATRVLMKDLVDGMYESHGKLDLTADPTGALTLIATGSAKAGGASNKGASSFMGFSVVNVRICDPAAPARKYTLSFDCTPTAVTKSGQGQVFYGAQQGNTLFCDYFKGTTGAMHTIEVTADADGKASVDGLALSLRVDAGGGAIGETSTAATIKLSVQ